MMKKIVLTVGIPVSESSRIVTSITYNNKTKAFRISTLQNSIRIDFSAPLPEVCSKLVRARFKGRVWLLVLHSWY